MKRRSGFWHALMTGCVVLSVRGSLPALEEGYDDYVVPRGLECEEGNVVIPEDGCTSFPNGWRNQLIIAAEELMRDLEGPLLITGLAWRPDGTNADVVGTLRTREFVLRLSTTSASPRPGGHSLVFADNVGDDEVEVYRGDWETPIQNADACGPGGPKEFEYFLEFQTPFVYDPAAGNLVVDRWHSSCSTPIWDMDGQASSSSVMVGGPTGSPRGFVSTNEVAVLRFRVAPLTGPEPAAPVFLRGDCNDDGAVDLADAVCSLEWLFAGRATPGCLAAANANGDAVVDLSDPVFLLAYLFLGGPTLADPFPACGVGNLDADDEPGCETPPAGCLE